MCMSVEDVLDASLLHGLSSFDLPSQGTFFVISVEYLINSVLYFNCRNEPQLDPTRRGYVTDITHIISGSLQRLIDEE